MDDRSFLHVLYLIIYKNPLFINKKCIQSFWQFFYYQISDQILYLAAEKLVSYAHLKNMCQSVCCRMVFIYGESKKMRKE